MFLPDNPPFTDVDYSQVELRILANISEDYVMMEIFNQPTYLPDGKKNPLADIHGQTAEFMGIDRKIAKNVNFSVVYGASDKTVMETAEISNLRKAQEIMQMWATKFYKAYSWIQDTKRFGQEHGYVETIFGRKLYLPIDEDEEQIGRKAVNYPIQGSSAEITKRALIKLEQLPMVLTVHDEILVDGKFDIPDIEHIAKFHTPIGIKYVERWG
jgi:DNA polymerase-1